MREDQPVDDTVLELIGEVRRLAFDRTMPPTEALGRIRDAFRDYDA